MTTPPAVIDAVKREIKAHEEWREKNIKERDGYAERLAKAESCIADSDKALAELKAFVEGKE